MVLLFVALVLFGSGLGILAGAIKTAPRLSDVQFNSKRATVLYDTNNEVIGRLFTENRQPVSLDNIPKVLQHAVIASEDDHFYEHHGVRPTALLRAVLVDVFSGRKAQGGSTITQQLARNAFLSQEKTFTRKINEIIWAIQIERKYTKDEILETYLNEAYLGHGAHGVEAAAQLYFGKHVSQLNLPEAALIVGLLPAPEAYSPYVDMKAAEWRRGVVLDRMTDLGYITSAEAEAAKNAPIKVVGLKLSKTKAPYFVDYVTQYLLDRYGESQVYSGGLKVFTTLDLKAQAAAEKALFSGLPGGRTDKNGLTQPQGALLAMDPKTGYIRAMIGGRGEDKYNRATQAYRQPGSTIKPFIYTAAIDRGFTPISMVQDAPIEFQMADGQTWKPQNYDRKFRGPIPLRYALENSINTVAIRLLDQIGIGTAMDYAKRMGITSLVSTGAVNDNNLSLALGGITKGVNLMEMVQAYGVLANQGIKVTPLAVLRVEDKDGRVLEENQTTKDIILSEETAYVTTDMMRGVIERGTGRSANIGRPSAGKTGTTDDSTNAWFVGFTPDLVSAVWIGNDAQSQPLSVGSAKSAAIWGAFMRDALSDTPISDFPQPAGVVRAYVDMDHGTLATDRCPNVRLEVFVTGTEPTQYCTYHGGQPLPPPPPPEPPATGLPDQNSPGATGDTSTLGAVSQGDGGGSTAQPGAAQGWTTTKPSTPTPGTVRTAPPLTTSNT
jgi:penicillin-binding protein 1A